MKSNNSISISARRQSYCQNGPRQIHPKFSSCHQNTAGRMQQAEHNKVPRRLGRLEYYSIQSGIQTQQQEQLTRSTSVPRNLRGYYLFSGTVYNNPIFSARRQHLPTPSTPTTPCSQYHGSTVRQRQAYKVTGYLNQHVGQSPTLHTAAHTFGNDAHLHYPTHSSRSSLRRLSALTERLSRIGRLRQSLWCG